MPIYDFNCDDCGTFEILRPSGESSEPVTCPECGSESQRIFSMPAFRSLSDGQKELRRIEERSGEPTISEKPPSSHKHDRGSLKKGHGRPWQLGH